MVMEHYVPRFYLRLFSPENDDQISRYTLVEKHGGGEYYPPRDRYPISKAAAVESYAGGLLEEPLTNRAERAMKQAVSRLIDERKLTGQDIAHISQFIAFQRDRGPASKFFHQGMEIFAEEGLASGPSDHRWEHALTHNAGTGHEILQHMGWRLLKNRTDYPFITSDQPVIWYLHSPDVSSDNDRHNLSNMEIYCPIGPNHVLVLLDPGTFDIEPQQRSTNIVSEDIFDRHDIMKINLLQVMNSFQEVFGTIGYGSLLEVIVTKLCDAHPDPQYVRGAHTPLWKIEHTRQLAIGSFNSESAKKWYKNTGRKIITDQHKSIVAKRYYSHKIGWTERQRRDTKIDYWQ
jgi:hypothetical protein